MVEPPPSPAPLGSAPGVDVWGVDGAYVDSCHVDVDTFIVKLRVAPDTRFFLETPGVLLAGSWTPGRDTSTMNGMVQLTTAPILMYTHQVRCCCVDFTWGCGG